jgi:FKBP-type peptidyl-prolyl cis-trans isomerase
MEATALSTVAIAATRNEPLAKPKRAPLGTLWLAQDKQRPATTPPAPASTPTRTAILADAKPFVPKRHLAMAMQERPQQPQHQTLAYRYTRQELLKLRQDSATWPAAAKPLEEVYEALPEISPKRALMYPIMIPCVWATWGPSRPPAKLNEKKKKKNQQQQQQQHEAEAEALTQAENDPRRLEQRQKQILFGHNTLGYMNFVRFVPISLRVRGDPVEPYIGQRCSKRSWEGQVRKWRRLLHYYDSVRHPGEVPPLRRKIAAEERARIQAKKAAKKAAAAAACEHETAAAAAASKQEQHEEEDDEEDDSEEEIVSA